MSAITKSSASILTNLSPLLLFALFTAGAVTPAPPLYSTALQVAEVTQNSVRLVWNPLPGATGYILRWGDELGESFYHLKLI